MGPPQSRLDLAGRLFDCRQIAFFSRRAQESGLLPKTAPLYEWRRAMPANWRVIGGEKGVTNRGRSARASLLGAVFELLHGVAVVLCGRSVRDRYNKNKRSNNSNEPSHDGPLWLKCTRISAVGQNRAPCNRGRRQSARRPCRTSRSPAIYAL